MPYLLSVPLLTPESGGSKFANKQVAEVVDVILTGAENYGELALTSKGFERCY